MHDVVISDTSCLIVLSKIGELEILRKRYKQILIPSIVEREFGSPLPEWITVSDPSATSLSEIQPFQLDAGEEAAIAVALDHQECLLIVDDEKARRVAERMQITITGTLGVLVKAKRAGLVDAIRPLIDRIAETDFRISQDVIRRALSEAGEL